MHKIISFFTKLKNAIGAYKSEFFKIEGRELTRLSKLLMMIFFFTAIWLVSSGVNMSIRQTQSPYEKYGYECTSWAHMPADLITIDRFEKHENSHGSDFGNAPICVTLHESFEKTQTDVALQSEIKQARLLEEKTYHIAGEINRLNSEYSSMLLEKISGQKEEASILKSNADDVKSKIQNLENQKSALESEIKTKRDLNTYLSIQAFETALLQNKTAIIEGFEGEMKWYALFRSAQVFAFLIPIWLLFYFAFKKLQAHSRHVFARLSFYVASAAGFLGLLELIALVYNILPKLFFAKIIAFLMQYDLGIVVNIVGILIFLLLFGVIIMKVQKNDEQKRKTKDIRLLNVKASKCFNCASPVKFEDHFCAFCGEDLNTICPKCQSVMRKYTHFCTQCKEALPHEVHI